MVHMVSKVSLVPITFFVSPISFLLLQTHRSYSFFIAHQILPTFFLNPIAHKTNDLSVISQRTHGNQKYSQFPPQHLQNYHCLYVSLHHTVYENTLLQLKVNSLRFSLHKFHSSVLWSPQLAVMHY